MVDVIALLQCPVCGTFYKPEITATGRPVPHCALPDHAPHLNLSIVQFTEYWWLDGEVYVDFEAIERQMLERYGLTKDVVDPPLTGSLLDIEV